MTAPDLDQISLARKELIHARLNKRGAPPRQRRIPRRPNIGSAPLSAAQRQLWYLHQLAPESVAYNESVTIRKDGAFDHAAFVWAFNEVISRHEAWRTTFVQTGDEPRQIVHPHSPIDLPITDLTELPLREAEVAAVRKAADIASAPYDLARGPLLRPLLVKLTPTHHRLYLAMHHLIFDGVSLYRIVLPELVASYDARRTGAVPALPQPPIQYTDYALWEQEWVDGADAQRRLARCRDRLADIAPLNLPLDHSRPPRQRFRGSMLPLTIDAATGQRLRAIAVEHDATLFQILAAVYAYWLHCYTEDDDVVFATAHDLRAFPELEPMVGYCLTPIVLRTTVTGSATCVDLLRTMRAELLEAMSCAVPFEPLVRAVDPPRDQRRNPLFQAALVLEPPMISPDPAWSIHQMESEIGELMGQSKFDVSIELDEREDGTIDGRLIFNTDLFDTATARLMLSHFHHLLRNAAAEPDTPLVEVRGPDETDRRRQLTQFNPPAPHPGSDQRCVHRLLIDQAGRTPDAVAVVVGDDRLSYRQLVSRAHAVAARLAGAGAGPGTIVATWLDRSVDLVPALLGVLLTGAAYLPLDPHHPPARSRFMIDDAGATILLTDTPSAAPPVPPSVTTVAFDERHSTPPADATPADPAALADPAGLAYVIYTSGSTGKPKGVQVEHHNVVNLMTGLPATLGISSADIVLSVASATFDVSVGDIFPTLGVGGTVVLAGEAETKDPRALADLIERSQATVMSATPTTWSMLVSSGWAGRPGLLAMTAGEPLPDHLAAEMRQRTRAVWNATGPTEVTVYNSGGFVDDDGPISVGAPLPGVRVYVMDDCDRLVPCGVPGEIVVAGCGVTRGYLNRPEETARRFRPDPFVDGERMYRTGDRGRLLPDGRLQHLGRYDTQVKVRGFRVELGEIESVLIEHPHVHEVAVDVRPDSAGAPSLVAYVVTASHSLDAARFRQWARSRLPAYMVPSAVVSMPALPRSRSGKLDRATLPTPDAAPSQHRSDRGHTRTQQRLAELWTRLLPGTAADPCEDFFDAGGHSVLATRLLLDVERRFGVAVTVADFLDRGRSLAGLAALIDDAATTPGPAGAATLPAPAGAATLPRLFFVYPDLPSSMSLRHLSELCGRENQLCPLIAPTVRGRLGRPATVEDVAAPLLKNIRAAQPVGPYRLIGYSFGGLLAYELARLVADGGDEVCWLGLLDTPTPAAARALMRTWKSPSTRMALLRKPGRAKLIADYGSNLSWAAREKLIAAGLIDRRPGEQFDVRHAWQVMRAGDPQGHRVPMNLFVTADTIQQIGSDTLGWADVHDGPLHIHHAPGDHDSLLSETFAEDFTALIVSRLRAAAPPSQSHTAAKELTR